MSTTIHYYFVKLDRGEKYWEEGYNTNLDMIDSAIYGALTTLYGNQIHRTVVDNRNIDEELTRIENRVALAAVLNKAFTAGEEYPLNHLLNDSYPNALIWRLIGAPVNKYYKEELFLTNQSVDANNILLKNELPETATYKVLAFLLKT